MKKLLFFVVSLLMLFLTTDQSFAYLSADFSAATCNVRDSQTLRIHNINTTAYGRILIDFQWDPNYYDLYPVYAAYESGSGGGGGSSSCSAKPSVSGLSFPSSVAAGDYFCVSYNYSDPNGLSDVKEHHILMSDGTNAVFQAAGSGSFNSCSFYFDYAGTYSIQVYVVDSCGNQSNAPSGSITVYGGFSGGGCYYDSSGHLICINSVGNIHNAVTTAPVRPKKF